MSKAKNLRDQSVEELEAKCEDLKKSLFVLRSQQRLEKTCEKPHLLRENRREIARIKTLIREKSLSS